MAIPATTGLEDVVVGPSAISEVNGQTGQLYYRGYRIFDLARESTFEEVVWLLWEGELPTATQLRDFRLTLAQNKALPDRTAALVDSLAMASAAPMVALRLATGMLEVEDPCARSIAPSSERQASLHLVARYPTIVARFHRRRLGLAPIAPPPDTDTATAFLTMLHGVAPDPADARDFDAVLIIHADHEFNASTFTARVIAATLANVFAAVDGAIGALSGPLHGGANEQVMRMLEAIGSPDRAEAYIQNLLAQKQRIMGFGHRVYKTEDPRAVILQRICRDMAQRKHDTRWYDIATRVAQVVWNAKHLYPNVDFFSAPVLHMLGIPTDLFTLVFAVSRISGWTAHLMEQHANNRLIRPRAAYVGPAPRPYLPLSRR